MSDEHETNRYSEPHEDPIVRHVAELDGRGRATLRRSLAFKPGAWPPAFPYIEPWIRGKEGWRRHVAYLAAGLQATSRAARPEGNVGDAARRLSAATGSSSTEQRFIALLEADTDELPHRLRQMIALMSAYDIAPDWAVLRHELTSWRHPDRYIQQRWARSFYARPDEATDTEVGDEHKEE